MGASFPNLKRQVMHVLLPLHTLHAVMGVAQMTATETGDMGGPRSHWSTAILRSTWAAGVPRPAGKSQENTLHLWPHPWVQVSVHQVSFPFSSKWFCYGVACQPVPSGRIWESKCFYFVSFSAQVSCVFAEILLQKLNCYP